MRASILALVLVASLAMLSCPMIRAEGPDLRRLEGSHRYEKDGWIFVRLEGPPERLGYQHGYLLAAEIADTLRVLPQHLEHGTKRDWAFYRKKSEEMLWKGITPEYQSEIDAIVAGLHDHGVTADRWDLVALNAIPELPDYYVPWLDSQEGNTPKTHAPGNCSAFVATGSATKDGRIVMGHNNWTSYVSGTRANIVFDLHPEHGYRILMDGYPGCITSGDDFGVNSAGILMTETTISQFDGFDPAGTPEFSRSRHALQYSQSIDDFVRIMREHNNGGYANDWLLGDNKTGEIALFELGLKNDSVRRTKDGYFVGANYPIDPKLIAEETHFDVTKADSSPNARRTRWEALMKEWKGKIDIEAAKELETDTFDVIANKKEASERTLCGAVERSPRGSPEWDWGPFFPGGTVQVKVIDAKMADTMAFWGAIGHPGAPDFHVDEFLEEHSDYEWMRPGLKDVITRPWARFEAEAHASR